MCITQEPTGIHVTHDMFDAVECDAGIGGIMHGENDAGDELNNQRNARENTEIPEIVQVPRDRVASTNGIIDTTRQRKAGIDPLHERILWGIVFSPGKTHDLLSQPPVTTNSSEERRVGTTYVKRVDSGGG